MNSFIVMISKKIFMLIFSAYLTLSGTALITPSTADTIKPSGNANLVFALIADPQLSNYMPARYNYFQAAAADLKNAEGLDALLNAGDVAENGLAMEYSIVADELDGLDVRHIVAEGNHDIRLRVYEQSLSRFNEFINTLNGDEDAVSFHHSETLGGYKFIVLGSDRTEFEENYLSPEQLEWLDKELASVEEGQPRFVMVHQPLKNTNGLPKVWNSPIDSAGSIGPQSDELQAILDKYSNVFLITGHEHTGFGEYTYEKVGKNIHSVNVPSLCVNNKDGENNDHGLAFVVEVYDGNVLFRARNLSEGKWLPEFDLDIPLENAPVNTAERVDYTAV